MCLRHARRLISLVLLFLFLAQRCWTVVHSAGSVLSAWFNVSQSAACLLHGTGDDLFEWTDRDEVRYVRGEANEETCILLPFRAHPYYQRLHSRDRLSSDSANHSNSQSSSHRNEKVHSNLVSSVSPAASLSVLLIGDSFDLHVCVRLSALARRPVAKSALMDCLVSQELQVRFHRIMGLLHLDNMNWVLALQQMYRNQSASLRTNATDPDFVVFSSFAWDLLQSHREYCQRSRANKNASEDERTQSECYCDHRRFDTDAVCLRFSSAQEFASRAAPWCGSDFFLSWRTRVREALRAIQSAFPHAMLLLRNQPVSSSVFMGGPACANMLNQGVRRIALRDCGGAARLLDVHSLLLQGVHHLGTNTGPADRPRDHLHYFSAAHVWTDYVMNVVLSLRMSGAPSVPCKV